jgi:transcriptional regulator with XRE-family HTH domain
MNVPERLRTAREDAGLTQTELGALCGIHRRDIGKYENGTTINIPLANLEKVAGALNKPMAWFFLEDDGQDKSVCPLAELVDELASGPSARLTARQVKALTDFFREYKKDPITARTVEHGDIVPMSPQEKEQALKEYALPAKIHKVPRLRVAQEKAAAGRAADDTGPPEELVLAQHRWREDYKPFRIVGDSMAPYIMDGDYVVVDLVRAPVNGDTVIARNNDGLVVKQFFMKKDHIELVSINPEYETVRTRDLALLGVLVDIVRPVKKITE